MSNDKRKKLTIDDVVSIKRLLAKGESQGEIAEKFSVDRKSINNIANNQTWKSVRLDENGDYIEPAPKAPKTKKKPKKSLLLDKPHDEFIVTRYERIEIEPEAEAELTDEEKEILEIKREFLDRLWYLKPIIRIYKNQSYRSTRIRSTNDWFNKKLHNDWSKFYKPWRQIDLEEYMAQAAVITQETVINFLHTQKDFNWDGLLEDDRSVLNIIFSVINRAIHSDMQKFSQWMQQQQVTTRTETTGGKKEISYEYTSIGDDSTDELTTGAGEEETKLIELLTNETNLYAVSDDERLDHFIKFFEDKKRYFLTENQYHTWEIICATEHIPGGAGYTENDREIVYGINRSKAFRTRESVEKRAIEAYAEVYPELVKQEEFYSRIEIRKNQEKQILQMFIGIVDDEKIEPEDMNKKLSQFILERLDKNPFIFNLVYKNLRGKDLFNVTDGLKSGVIKGVTLYKLIDIAQEKLKELERFNTTVREFYRKDDEYVSDGKVVSIEAYRALQFARHPNSDSKYNPNRKTGKRKKHRGLRLTTSGASFEIDAGK